MLLSGDGRILMKMRNVETLHLKTAETEAKRRKAVDPRLCDTF